MAREGAVCTLPPLIEQVNKGWLKAEINEDKEKPYFYKVIIKL